MPPLRVTDKDIELILGLRVDENGNPRGSRVISELLLAKHNRKMHFATVNRVLQQNRAERTTVLREKVQEQVGATVSADIAVLDEMVSTLLDVFRKGRPMNAEDLPVAIAKKRIVMTPRDWNGVSAQLKAALETRFRLAGVDGGEDKEQGKTLSESLRGVMLELYPLANKTEEEAEALGKG